MFGKKPAATPSAPPPASRPLGFPVQVLTPDFVIGGYLPPMDTPVTGYLNLPAQASVTLSKCKLSGLNPQVAVPGDVAEITIPKANIIAVVPRDEAGVRSAMLNLPAAAVRASFYAGPFVIVATARLISENAFSTFFSAGGGSLFAATDATIRSLWPGAKFQELKVSAVFLNRQLIQLYHAL